MYRSGTAAAPVSNDLIGSAIWRPTNQRARVGALQLAYAIRLGDIDPCAGGRCGAIPAGVATGSHSVPVQTAFLSGDKRAWAHLSPVQYCCWSGDRIAVRELAATCPSNSLITSTDSI